MSGPFDLADEAAYRCWRTAKLAGYPAEAAELMVVIADPLVLDAAARQALATRLGKTNMALYRSPVSDEATARLVVRTLAEAFGLKGLEGNLCADADGLTPLAQDDSIGPGGGRARYIPYTNKPLNWHTDGYYNAPERRLHAMTLHCVSPANRGGENGLLDPEIAYILLRDESIDLVRALMHPHAMTIPANAEGDSEIREEMTGPVFDVEADGTLCMRYTARKRNIIWRDDGATRDAVAFLVEMMDNAASPYIFRYTLGPGEGLICNNVLHMRTGFEDGVKAGAETETRRLILRGRFYERIEGTAYPDIYS